MSSLTVNASQAFSVLLGRLTDLRFSEIMESRIGVKWSKATVNAKRRGITPLSLDDIDLLCRLCAVEPSYFMLDKHAAQEWVGKNKWCAPWELNPQPADYHSAAAQASFFDDTWDSDIDLRDRVMEPAERLAS